MITTELSSITKYSAENIIFRSDLTAEAIVFFNTNLIAVHTVTISQNFLIN